MKTNYRFFALPASFAFALLAFGWTSCSSKFVNCTEGSGKIVSENRTVDRFNAVKIKGSAKLYVTQDQSSSLRVEADDNVIKQLSSITQDGTLVIDTKGGCFSNVTTNVYVSMPDIKRLEISGSGSVIGKSSIKTDDLALVISGSGDAKLNVTANTINTNVSGAGNVTLEGKADTLNLNLSGAGEINAANLLTQQTFVTNSGAGTCEVNAVQRLDVKNSGVGNVYYTNNPPQLNVSSSGLGKVAKK